MPIKEKIEQIKKIKKECMSQYKHYKKRYKKIKKIDNAVDFTTSILNATALTLVVSSAGVPPFLIGSACASGLQFVICRVQDKMKLKDKYNAYLTTANQYYNLVNDIVVVLHNNHLTNEQYGEYIENVLDRVSLIRDTQIL